MFGKDDHLAVLETLSSTLTDSIKGYREAVDHSEAPELKNLFGELADDRERAGEELRAEIARLGGKPDTDGSTAGYLHQRFLDIKSAITGRDDEAIVNEVERGEDYIKEKFETALSSDELPPESRGVVDRVFQSVLQGHSQVSALKHSMARE